MPHTTVYLRFLLVCCFCFSAGTLFPQEQDMGDYPVEPVYPAPLDRPSIEFQRQALPEGTTGKFPTWDGEYFHLRFDTTEMRQPGEENARRLVDRILEGMNWPFDPDALRAVKPTSPPPAQKDMLEQHIKELSQQSQRELQGRFGNINDATREALREQEDLLRNQASEEMRIFQYDQYYRKLPIDNTSLRLVWREGHGFSSLSGRVFTQIEIANRNTLDASKALEAARSHIKESSELADERGQLPKPGQVLLPYGKNFRYTWKVVVQAVEGAYEVWIDAETGRVLQLMPMFASDDARGLVFDPDPNGTTREMEFEIDAPSGGQYTLTKSGLLTVTSSGADGVCSGNVSVSSSGSGTANFNVSPINGTTVNRTSDSGYNCQFQEVNTYGWIYNHLTTFNQILGSVALPDLSVTVNHNNPCGFGINNACANWGSWSLTFGIGQATVSSSTSCSDVYNSALDATVLTHELGHLVNHRNNTGTIPTHVDEGLADFWAYTLLDTDTFGDYWGNNCASHSQGGWTPRRVEGLDVFPEHRGLSTSGYGDGQMLGWALWNVRREFNESSALGALLINLNLIDALSAVSFVNSTTDQQIHNNFLGILQQLATQFSTSSNIHKVLSGFARAGFFLSPRDAVIDISDDYLNRNDATGPTFTVWTGRDYTFSGGTASTASPPYNTRYEIEMANDAAFTVNVRSSGVQSGVTASDGGKATWTMPAGDWTALKAQDKLYYRLTTTNASGGNLRNSEDPGNGFLVNVPVAYAVINESGACECSASARTPGSAALMTFVPLLIGIIWMRRLKNTR